MGDHDNVCFLFNLAIVSLMSFLHQCDMLLVINLLEIRIYIMIYKLLIYVGIQVFDESYEKTDTGMVFSLF